MDCFVCGDELDDEDRLAAPFPKDSSDLTREDTVGHWSCWSKAGFRKQLNGGARSPRIAGRERDQWMEKIGIDDVQEVRN
ncbi:MAG: hypothetical protein SVU32_04660 [Candidatus Nanohaloarchaea archaeon]|nr:hypothetical protein [Candidatus Nanohaloarchaea archaeon]